jgi:hypothetical protein
MRRMGISFGMRAELRTTCGGKREARGEGVERQISTKRKEMRIGRRGGELKVQS